MRTFVSFILLLFVGMNAWATDQLDRSIVVLGDSLSAAYGIEQRLGWVTLLQQRLQQQALPFQVVNASISGDTTRGGLSRLPATLQQAKPEILIIELGANDGLRGFPPDQIKANLARLIDQGQAAGAQVLLLGIKLPMNYGRAFGEKFHQVYLDLAQETGVALVPFFLEGVAETREMMQADGVHPAAAAQPRILDNVWAALSPMIAKTKAR